MGQTGWQSILVVCVCCLALTAPGLATHSPTADRFAQDIDADTVIMEPTLDADGDATWRVVYRLSLDSDDRTRAFEELRSDLANNESAYLGPFEDRIRRTAETAQSATGREMTVRNFSVTADRTSQPDSEFGEVTFRFTWRGFAATEGDTLRAGDALDRLVLDEETTLRVRWPEAYSLTSHAPAATVVEDQRVIWRGPLDFNSGEPSVVVSADESTSGEGGSLVALLAGGAILLVGIGAGWLLFVREQGETETAARETDDGPPPELLSNEERVLQLLEGHGGRMKQTQVAEELDWTDAKTSQVVGDLREDEDIEAFRLGRENVLTLPDVDITDADDADDEQ